MLKPIPKSSDFEKAIRMPKDLEKLMVIPKPTGYMMGSEKPKYLSLKIQIRWVKSTGFPMG